MTEKELRRLNRKELLEMLIVQSKELNRVQQELNETKRQLNDRRILLEDAGSISEAALKLNHVFEAAQEAANQYLENIKGGHEVSAVSEKPEEGAVPESAESKAEEILRKAEEERKALLEKTEKECAEMMERTEESCRHMQYQALLEELKGKYDEE